ncbi:MAG: AMP-dependent synthetase/ligase [Bifidobacteriaceae bacterium]|jgi:long-chain acyl-CoA synthetase|nr:AMP-dependent synthetase/ligase [Bifidobacteriaceae bacterium]
MPQKISNKDSLDKVAPIKTKIIKESSIPHTFNENEFANIGELTESRVKRDPDGILIEYIKNDEWFKISTKDFHKNANNLAKGLISLGLKKGDKVGIMSHTSYEWVLLDIAAMKLGLIPVPIYETSSIEQIKYILNDSGIKHLFVEDRDLKSKVNVIFDAVPTLEEVDVFSELILESLIEIGSNSSTTDAELKKIFKDVKHEDIATIIYTSGSTGNPKGAVLTHGAFIFVVQSGYESVPYVFYRDNARLLLFLPLAHVFARYLEVMSLAGTITMGLSGGIKTLLKDLGHFKPTFLLGVPRVFEKIYNAASQKAGATVGVPEINSKVFADATKIAVKWCDATDGANRSEWNNLKINPILKAQHEFHDKVVYENIRKVIGGNAVHCISGGAPINPELAKFFTGAGMQMLQGFGMTETIAPAMICRQDLNKVGTVGLPFVGVKIAVDENDELLIGGPTIFSGYNNNQALTDETIIDGWVHTGDLASIDDDGNITLIGRKKDIIITAGGKNVIPIPLENIIKTSTIVSEAVVIGEARPFIAAIITLDLMSVNIFLNQKGLEAVSSIKAVKNNPTILEELNRVVDLANETVSRAESIRKFAILEEDFNITNGTLTPSMKIVRPKINTEYVDFINQEIYSK